MTMGGSLLAASYGGDMRLTRTTSLCAGLNLIFAEPRDGPDLPPNYADYR